MRDDPALPDRPTRRRALALAAGGALALAGCGGRPAPLPERPAAETPAVAIRRGARNVAGADGTPLAATAWRPAGRPRAAILALHGFGETAPNTWGAAARHWAARGIAVEGYDHRGFGRNPSRKVWPGAEALVADAVAVSRQVRVRHPDMPLVVVGHSMGGGVALAAAAAGLEADALVLAAPAIAGGAQMSPVYRLGGWALGTFAPDRRFTGGDAVTLVPTDNPDALAAAAADPLHFADASGRELWGLVRVSDLAARAAPRVGIPVMTVMGAHDDYVRAAGVRAVHESIPGAARFEFYPEGWHWLFRDRQARAVWEDVGDFVLGLPAPA
ncbi:alpha/beta fold hydrolase [Rhodovulum sp. 12E13]|uniref:alpha/beta fold hydrolase n=1 Tax=Rhodovulum sp. 12E13 TaxID=2203891 RepID=UPI0013141E76|nr:alpha/beta fold hydrolase [Rhodovulum sp. 12E13]